MHFYLFLFIVIACIAWVITKVTGKRVEDTAPKVGCALLGLYLLSFAVLAVIGLVMRLLGEW